MDEDKFQVRRDTLRRLIDGGHDVLPENVGEVDPTTGLPADYATKIADLMTPEQRAILAAEVGECAFPWAVSFKAFCEA